MADGDAMPCLILRNKPADLSAACAAALPVKEEATGLKKFWADGKRFLEEHEVPLLSPCLLHSTRYFMSLTSSRARGSFQLRHCTSLSSSQSTAMWCDVWVWASALEPHTHTITHSHILPITCTCCYDEIKRSQDQDFSYSFSDSLSSSRSIRCFIPFSGSVSLSFAFLLRRQS